MRVFWLIGWIFLAPLVCAASAQRSANGLSVAISLLSDVKDPAAQADVLRGISDALEGRRQVAMPAGWHEIYARLETSPNAEVREKATALALLFGDPQAIESLTRTVRKGAAGPDARRRAIEALVSAKIESFGPELLKLLDDPAVRAPAIRGLAAYNEPATAKAILALYPKLPDPQKKDAINTLVARPGWAAALLDAVEQGIIPRGDLSAYTVRQLAGLNDPAVNERLQKLGSVRPPTRDKAALIANYKKMFTPDVMANADPAHGREIFNKTCAACHTLFDSGGNVGPNLTGAQRSNLDYILENVVDPSAVVAKDYLMTVVQTKDGRVINGIIRQENAKSITLRTTTEDVTLPIEEIQRRKTSPISMMPEGLLEGLSTEDARDLIGYLASPAQVPLRGAPK